VALSEDQFNALVDAHGPTLYRVAYRLVGDPHESEDLVQETFRSAWTSRERYESHRGDRAWLISILRRRAVDRWRRRPRWSLTTESGASEPIAVTPPPAIDGYTDEMQTALNALPLELRETILLVVVGELTHREAAEVLEIPLGTVLSRVSRARERLREYLVAARA
jgi:RNA polymerase sigma-70 factor (ECF subfamily)